MPRLGEQARFVLSIGLDQVETDQRSMTAVAGGPVAPGLPHGCSSFLGWFPVSSAPPRISCCQHLWPAALMPYICSGLSSSSWAKAIIL